MFISFSRVNIQDFSKCRLLQDCCMGERVNSKCIFFIIFSELCPPTMSYCSALKKCIPRDWWCDGKVDCPNGDDEGLYCKYKECLLTDFQCVSGRCIDMTYKCDGNNDCGPNDNSDEVCMSRFNSF